MTHAIDHTTQECVNCGASAAMIEDGLLACFAITFFLGPVKPSAEHTASIAASNPVSALMALYDRHPEAKLPISIAIHRGQGQGHKPL